MRLITWLPLSVANLFIFLITDDDSASSVTHILYSSTLSSGLVREGHRIDTPKFMCSHAHKYTHALIGSWGARRRVT